jgi:hypothetical protein
MPHRHCPYCNSTAVVGLGATFMMEASQAVVEMRCSHCGELFYSDDRRNTIKDERFGE